MSSLLLFWASSGQHFSAPGILARFTHFTLCYVGLKTRIIAQVLAYALTAIEREPELGTIISTTYTPWAIICLKKYNFIERWLKTMLFWFFLLEVPTESRKHFKKLTFYIALHFLFLNHCGNSTKKSSETLWECLLREHMKKGKARRHLVLFPWNDTKTRFLRTFWLSFYSLKTKQYFPPKYK